MKKIPFNKYLSISLTIFAMTFGAGNLMYPLSTGYWAGNNVTASILGFFLASIFIPLAGLIATAWFEGNYTNFLKTFVGYYPAELITLCSMLLLGPTGCIPRCMLLAHSSLNIFFQVPKILFAVIFYGLCFLAARKKNNLVNILGSKIAPITLTCCFILIIIGLSSSHPEVISSGKTYIFSGFKGFYNGCFTFDLLALIFYSRVIYSLVTETISSHNYNPILFKKETISIITKAGCLATIFFGIVYGGMIIIANMHAQAIPAVTNESQLFILLSNLLLGTKLGFIQAVIILLACFSAALSLSVVFADYLSNLSKEKLSYSTTLKITIATSWLLSFLEFNQIHTIMNTLIVAAYPVLILSTLATVFRRMFFQSYFQENN